MYEPYYQIDQCLVKYYIGPFHRLCCRSDSVYLHLCVLVCHLCTPSWWALTPTW